MEAVVLSKKAQKKSLSGKKGNRETVKNVLANPYSNYFPLLNSDDAATVADALKGLPKLRAPKTAVPWIELKDVPRKERKKARAKFETEVVASVDPAVRSSFILGVNEVTKLLENDYAAAVLIADDVNPQFMVRHVIDLCVLRKTPVVVMPGMRKLLKTVTGIATLTLAVKKPLIEGNCLSKLAECVEAIAEKYVVPTNHVHYREVGADEESDLDDNLKSLELCEDELVGGKDLYLYRGSKSNGRVFMPELSNSKDVVDDMDVDDGGFISFGVVHKKVPVKKVYKGLKVKRVRNNKNRTKKLKMKV